MTAPFIPTVRWYVKVLLVILLLCTAGFFVLSLVAEKLPAAYQPPSPAAEVTPWLN